MRFSTILFFTAGIITYFGCSASSGSLRYNSNSNDTADDTNNLRFTSNDSLIPTSEKDIFTTPLFDTAQDTLHWDDEEDDMPDDQGIDIAEVMKNLSSKDVNTNPVEHQNNFKEQVLMEIIKYLDTPYKYGGNSINGIDCSAFTKTIYGNVLSIDLLRSARDQYTQGIIINNRDELKFGDLVFFDTRRRVKPGHVGIYIGDNLFAHSSSKNGVIVSSLDQDYYSRKFMGGRRIENLD
ncbi:MAG: C40 family peptidase [Ignavibacteriales bacterium]|nr:C40 family peptidase [Ignavibacteriales bacterium]